MAATSLSVSPTMAIMTPHLAILLAAVGFILFTQFAGRRTLVALLTVLTLATLLQEIIADAVAADITQFAGEAAGAEERRKILLPVKIAVFGVGFAAWLLRWRKPLLRSAVIMQAVLVFAGVLTLTGPLLGQITAPQAGPAPIPVDQERGQQGWAR